jgi:hypothetical protein
LEDKREEDPSSEVLDLAHEFLQDPIFFFPVMSHPMAKQAIIKTITTKAIIKVRNKLDTDLSFLIKLT